MEPIKWNDEKIEEHLKHLPPIRDRRSKQDLFLKVQANINYKDNKGKRLPSWSIPALATACALVIFGVFAPDLVKNGIQMENSKVAEQSDKREEKPLEDSADKDQNSAGIMKAEPSAAYHTPYLEKNLKAMNKDWVTVGYLDDQAQLVIPVSFLTDQDFYVNKVNKELKAFNPNDVGLADSPLEKAKITEEEETVIVDLPAGSIDGAEEPLLQALITMTFANENQKAKVELRMDGDKGYEFQRYGTVSEWDLKVPGAPHFRYDAPSTDAFIVSLYATGIDTRSMPKEFEDALEMMDDDQERGLKPLLPKNTVLGVKVLNKDDVEITFPDSIKLSADDTEDLMMIDAILLTAESYGFESVKFNNTKIDSIGPYKLSEEIEGVTGANFYQ